MGTGSRPDTAVRSHRAPRGGPSPSVVLGSAAAALAVLLVLLVVVARFGGQPDTQPAPEAGPTPEDTSDLSDPAKRDVAMQLVSSAEDSGRTATPAGWTTRNGSSSTRATCT
ncbi:hypothetical protein ACI789_02775 [Geodermatophilus sp. SYSU D00965]